MPIPKPGNFKSESERKGTMNIVKNIKDRGREKTTKPNVNSSVKLTFHPEEVKESEEQVTDKPSPNDKLDLLVSLMTGHIKKHNEDISDINKKLEEIKENAKRIQANEESIVRLTEEVSVVDNKVDSVERRIDEEVSKIAASALSVAEELETRPTSEEVQKLVTDTVKRETDHLVTIMRNLVNECKKTSPQPHVSDFPALDEQSRPRYLEVANNTTNQMNIPVVTNPVSDPASRNLHINAQARNTVREAFERPKSQEELISFHKQIVGIKPASRKNLNFHAKAIGMNNPEKISDSIMFYCPTFFEFRRSFAYDFLFEIFGITKSDINITDVKMANKISSEILWITIGENAARHLFGLVGRIQKPNIWIIQSIPPNMIERRRAIIDKMEELRKLNENLRYQIRLGKSDFRSLSKNYKTTEYTRFRDVAISVIDPLDTFPHPSRNHQPIVEDSHARLIAEAVEKAREANSREAESDWSTVGKRQLSPQQVERNLRKKLNSPVKINAALQRIISGERIIDLSQIGINEEEIQLADAEPENPATSDPPAEETSSVEEPSAEETMEFEQLGEPSTDELEIVNLGASVSKPN